MKKTIAFLSLTLLASFSSQAQTVLADWTFESSGLTTSAPNTESPGAGVSTTNFYAEAGTEAGSAAATGLHAGAATYTSSSGNGSPKSLSSPTWAVGDYYQFALNTTGYGSITVSFDQISSGTGPGSFQFEYSTDGTTFTAFGSPYTVLTNSWNTTTTNTATSYTENLSAIAALNGASTVYFRLADASTVSGAGGTVGTSGTDRVDNFIVNGVSAVPEPSILALAGMGGAALFGLSRRLRK